MIRKVSLVFIVTLWLVAVVYLGLLCNWFRYGLSLEAAFVAMPLVLGTFVSSTFAILAYRRNSTICLLLTFVGTVMTGFLVVAAQFQAYGEMSSLYANDVQKSPIGRIVTPKGEVHYWVELENPFASNHREYVVIRRNSEKYRVRVAMSKSPLGGYASAIEAADWGQLESTTAPDIYVLRIGSYLPARGSIFRINLATGVVEMVQRKGS